MRKVEKQIVNIVTDFQKRAVTGTCRRTRRDRIESENGNVSVYLWGTRIAEVDEHKIALYTGGYRTVTTKSRLNALLRLANHNLAIYQKNFEWFVYDSALDETSVFSEGMTIARFV